MFEKEKLTGADISIDFCGYKLQSPFILSCRLHTERKE